MLRFGDGSPFPLGEGFLDLVVDAVNACTLMLGASARLDHKRAAADAVRRELADEQRRLEELEHSVESATAPCRPANVRPGRTSQRAAEQMLHAARRVLEQSRHQLDKQVARRGGAPSWRRTARRVDAAAGRFFDRHSLPGTAWAWWWDASDPSIAVPRCEAIAQSRRFAARFDLDVAPLWRGAIRIDALVPGFAMRLPRRRLFRDPIVEPIALARHALVYAHRDANGRELELRDPSGTTGWRIELPERGQASATVVDRKGRELGIGLVADDEIEPLVRAIDEAMIVHLRVRYARGTSLDGKPIAELDDTTAAARALLDEIAPTLREIRERSRVPGELSLKRDVGDRLREEVFISRASLTARFATLPAAYRQLFDAAGLGRSADSVVGEPAAEVPPTARAAARPSQPPIAERAVQAPERSAPPAASPSAWARPSQPLTVPSQPALRPSRSPTIERATIDRMTIERLPPSADSLTAEPPTLPKAAADDAPAPARPAPAPRAAQPASAPQPGAPRLPWVANATAAPTAAVPSTARAAQPSAAASQIARAAQPSAAASSIARAAQPSAAASQIARAAQPSVAASQIARAAQPSVAARSPGSSASAASTARAPQGTTPPRIAAGSVYLVNQPDAPTVPRAPALPELPPADAFDPAGTRDETQPMFPAPNPVRPLPGVAVARVRPVSSAVTPSPVTVTGEITVRR